MPQILWPVVYVLHVDWAQNKITSPDLGKREAISTKSDALSRSTISGIGVNIWEESVAKEWTERSFNNYLSQARYGTRRTSVR